MLIYSVLASMCSLSMKPCMSSADESPMRFSAHAYRHPAPLPLVRWTRVYGKIYMTDYEGTVWNYVSSYVNLNINSHYLNKTVMGGKKARAFSVTISLLPVSFMNYSLMFLFKIITTYLKLLQCVCVYIYIFTNTTTTLVCWV